ncbi:UNVERIFIED_CONTAM: hypothetical protein Sradi_3987500 [Sesamum radiatum]|uniref:Reverse transcriptase domain-containing protein n=1 Tax=Sesamum radiatum TaxID=300843 RepID=A0AAW2PLJ9_SESRA
MLHIQSQYREVVRGQRRSQFRFDARWLQSDECKGVVETAWQVQGCPDPNMRLWRKIQGCRLSLIHWNMDTFNRSKYELKILEEKYTRLEGGLLDREAHSEMKQAANRHRQNNILRLRDEAGVWREKQEDIQGILFRYFRDIFTSSGPSSSGLEEVLSLVPPRVTSEMNETLVIPFTAAEIKQAIFEVFSCLLQDAERRGRLTGVSVASQAPRVSHLLFADNTLVFCAAAVEQICEVKRILRLYVRVLGQEINLPKSSMAISGGIPRAVKEFLGTLLGVRVVQRHEKYLGLPAMGGRSRQMLFRNIRDRCWDRIEGWKAKLLSQAGKGVLVKAVLQSLPTYTMSCFQLPVNLVRSLESMMANVWWHNRGEKRVHWVAWRKLCRPAVEGGCGFRN